MQCTCVIPKAYVNDGAIVPEHCFVDDPVASPSYPWVAVAAALLINPPPAQRFAAAAAAAFILSSKVVS